MPTLEYVRSEIEPRQRKEIVQLQRAGHRLPQPRPASADAEQGG
jgi:hypothetical protein